MLYGEKGIFYFVNHIQNSIDAICIIAWVSHGEIENRRKLFASYTHANTHAHTKPDDENIDMSIEIWNILRFIELLLNVHSFILLHSNSLTHWIGYSFAFGFLVPFYCCCCFYSFLFHILVINIVFLFISWCISDDSLLLIDKNLQILWIFSYLIHSYQSGSGMNKKRTKINVEEVWQSEGNETKWYFSIDCSKSHFHDCIKYLLMFIVWAFWLKYKTNSSQYSRQKYAKYWKYTVFLLRNSCDLYFKHIQSIHEIRVKLETISSDFHHWKWII